MNSTNIKPVEIKPECLEEYQKERKIIFLRIVRLRTSITILQIIAKFPEELLILGTENIFWNTLKWNFLDICTVDICALLGDSGSDTITIKKFKNKVCEKWAKDAYKVEVPEKLKKIRNERKKIEKKMEIISLARNKYMAHFTLEKQPSGYPTKEADIIKMINL